MPEIMTVEAIDVLGKLPEIVPWKSTLIGNDPIDLLVCCAGFEDRSSAIVTDLESCQVRTAFVVVYPTNSSENRPAIEDSSTSRSFDRAN